MSGETILFRLFVVVDEPCDSADKQCGSTDVHIAIHHIIADQWSLDVLISDITTAYRSWQERKEVCLPPLPLQLKDYSRQKNHDLDNRRQRHVDYWRKKLHPVLLSGLQERLVRQLHNNGHAFRSGSMDDDALIKQQLQTAGKAFEYNFEIDVSLFNQYTALAERLKVSLPAILIAPQPWRP